MADELAIVPVADSARAQYKVVVLRDRGEPMEYVFSSQHVHCIDLKKALDPHAYDIVTIMTVPSREIPNWEYLTFVDGVCTVYRHISAYPVTMLQPVAVEPMTLYIRETYDRITSQMDAPPFGYKRDIILDIMAMVWWAPGARMVDLMLENGRERTYTPAQKAYAMTKVNKHMEAVQRLAAPVINDDIQRPVFVRHSSGRVMRGQPTTRVVTGEHFILTASGRRLPTADLVPMQTEAKNWHTICALHPGVQVRAVLLALCKPSRVRRCIHVIERMASPHLYGTLFFTDKDSRFLMVFAHQGQDPRIMLADMKPKEREALLLTLIRYIEHLLTERHVVPCDYIWNNTKTNFLLSVNQQWFISDVKNVELARNAKDALLRANKVGMAEMFARALHAAGINRPTQKRLLAKLALVLSPPDKITRTVRNSRRYIKAADPK